MVTMTLSARQQKRHRCKEQTFGLCGRRRGWDDLSLRGPLSAHVVGKEAWLHRETQTPTTAIRTLVIQITLRDVS